MDRFRQFAIDTQTFCAPLPLIVEASKAAGFDAIDIGVKDTDVLLGGAAEAADLVDQLDIKVPTFQLLRDYEGSGETRAERLEEAEILMDAMIEIGAKTLLMCANTNPASSADTSEQIKDLRVLADLARTKGVQVGFEPLAWSQWINDYQQAIACVEAVDHPCLGLVLDVFHLFSHKTSLAVLDQIDIDKLFAVQLSNAVSMPLPTIEIARHHRLFPDQGEWPVAEVVQRVEARGYRGCYSIEVFNDAYKKQDPFVVAKRAHASLVNLFSPSEAELLASAYPT